MAIHLTGSFPWGKWNVKLTLGKRKYPFTCYDSNRAPYIRTFLKCIQFIHVYWEIDRWHTNVYLIGEKGRSFTRDRSLYNWITQVLCITVPPAFVLFCTCVCLLLLFFFFIAKQLISSHIYEGWNLHQFHSHSLYFHFLDVFPQNKGK